MGMYLSYNHSHSSIVEDLLHFGKIGQSKVLYGGYYNRSSGHGFIFTKCKKNLIKVYSMYAGYLRNSNFNKSVAEIKRGSKEFGGGIIKWRKGIPSHHHFVGTVLNGAMSYVYRAFISLGLVQNVGIRFMRTSELWKFQFTEIGSIRTKDFSFGFNGKLISQVPKECKELLIEAKESQRVEKNRSARANYSNTSTVAKVRNAKITGDYSKLVPQDVFKLRNVSIRTELLEHYGQDKVLDSIDHDVIHEDEIDGRKYELLRFVLPFKRFGEDDPTLATYLKMINPSTGETCIEGVPNNVQGSPWSTAIDMNHVQDALRWRDGDVKSYVVPQILT